MSIRKSALLLILLGTLVLTFAAGYSAYPLLHGASLPQPALLVQTLGSKDMDVFWETWKLLDRDFYGEKPNSERRTYGAIRGLVESFNDQYTYFVEPIPRELERDELRGSFGGIGADIETGDDGFILRPFVGQPADLAGIQEGDILLMVDDAEISPKMSKDEVIGLIHGPIGAQVSLLVRRLDDTGDSDELVFRIDRAEIETPSVYWRMVESDTGPETIGYIEHRLFTERSPQEIRQAVDELTAQGAQSFILDLRGNSGGLLDSAIKIADMWLSKGDILIERTANGSETVFTADEETVRDDASLIILVDKDSASASEIVAGALRDNGRGTIVGQTTYGKGSVQLVHELSDESSLHVTNAQWLTPNRVQISGHGLTPDVLVPEEEDSLATAIAEAEAWVIARALDSKETPQPSHNQD